jgi:hypothetical protein
MTDEGYVLPNGKWKYGNLPERKKCRDVNDWCDIGLRKDAVICKECRRINRKSIRLLDEFKEASEQ